MKSLNLCMCLSNFLKSLCRENKVCLLVSNVDWAEEHLTGLSPLVITPKLWLIPGLSQGKGEKREEGMGGKSGS